MIGIGKRSHKNSYFSPRRHHGEFQRAGLGMVPSAGWLSAAGWNRRSTTFRFVLQNRKSGLCCTAAVFPPRLTFLTAPIQKVLGGAGVE